MALGHERLGVYRLAIGYVAWLESAAIQDVLVVGKALDEAESRNRKMELDRMAAMLSRLGGRGYQVREDSVADGAEEAKVDPDPDSESPLEKPCARRRRSGS